MIGLIKKGRELFAEPFPVWKTAEVSSEYIWDEIDTHPLRAGELCGKGDGWCMLGNPDIQAIATVIQTKPRKVWMEYIHIGSPPHWRSTKKLKRVVIKRNLTLEIELTPLQLCKYFQEETFEIVENE